MEDRWQPSIDADIVCRLGPPVPAHTSSPVTHHPYPNVSQFMPFGVHSGIAGLQQTAAEVGQVLLGGYHRRNCSATRSDTPGRDLPERRGHDGGARAGSSSGSATAPGTSPDRVPGGRSPRPHSWHRLKPPVLCFLSAALPVCRTSTTMRRNLLPWAPQHGGGSTNDAGASGSVLRA